ncbi:hypothetical protein [Streptomyces olivochromogenes]|uniref:Uncharacterized protein n=1 Tax=Streptomyces olivochromogenes TaxID=1963 RepID=A0A250VSR0_STROL|nr:hypothetical protein [Streptomyces olivochromogenes]KUN38277.1 hypothetical protein AQJ27_45075 [Streptomyces olivochromogenes]GAX57278.1 hypothetical protein SO3561_08848 [Streptomyces olivochromogenes]
MPNTSPQPERTPYCHKIRYGITGAPILDESEMDGSHAPGVGVKPALIELIYSAAQDSQPAVPARVSASVTGWWMRFGERVQPERQVTTHFTNGPNGWPAWLAKEARLHDPAAAVSSASDGLPRMAEEAQRGWQQCPASEFDGYGLQCQKEAGHNLCTFEEPGQADEAQQPETQAAVAYRSPGTRTLYCLTCARQETAWRPVTKADVRDDTECDFCGGRVLAVASRTLGEVVARYLPAAVSQPGKEEV